MFVPFLSTPSVERRKLWRRKGGGGGGGRGGGGGGGRGGVSSGSSSIGKSSSIVTSSGTKSATTYSRGGGTASTIPAGSVFAGRSVGGGTRTDIYGSRQYGSGYPGGAGRGVGGRGFPFIFWPIAFGGIGLGSVAYLHGSEYGHPRNGSRPGGAQKVATFVGTAETYRLLSDGETVTALVEVVTEKCSDGFASSNSTTVDDYDGSDVEPPLPEQVVQYYRASSIALSLDGYNNTAVFADEGTADVPLPAVNQTFLNCLNATIGEAAPLIDGAAGLGSPSSIGLFGIVGMVLVLTSQL